MLQCEEFRRHNTSMEFPNYFQINIILMGPLEIPALGIPHWYKHYSWPVWWSKSNWTVGIPTDSIIQSGSQPIGHHSFEILTTSASVDSPTITIDWIINLCLVFSAGSKSNGWSMTERKRIHMKHNDHTCSKWRKTSTPTVSITRPLFWCKRPSTRSQFYIKANIGTAGIQKQVVSCWTIGRNKQSSSK